MLSRSMEFTWLLMVLFGAGLCVASQPVEIIADGTIQTARQPQAAVAEDGTIYVCFGAEDAIYCCRSDDGGKSFTSPIKVGQTTKLALGMRRGPRVVANKEFVVITAISHQDGNVQAWRSTDQGDSWEDPITINNSPGDAREGLHGMAMHHDGSIYCVWLDLRGGGTQIYGAASKDGGATWGENRRVYRSPDKSVCECCHPSVCYDASGNIHVMWRNSVKGSRDMYRTVSRDGGTSFEKAVKLGESTWKLEACPMDGGSIAATGTDEVATIWRREKHIYFTSSAQKKEQQLGAGEQPWVAANRQGLYLVWLTNRPGDLWLRGPQSRKPEKLATEVIDPMVAVNDDIAIVVWESSNGRLRARTFAN